MGKFLISIIVAFLLVIPHVKAEQIVYTGKTYTYEAMVKDIQLLQERYPNLIQVQSIGKTTFGRDIYCVKLGDGKASILLNGAHHAREWMTTSLLMKMIEEYASSYSDGTSHIRGFPVNILDKVSIYFVPMVNPDGVSIQQSKIDDFPLGLWPAIIGMNKGSTNLKRWKANGEGIDLNRQYPMNWKNLKGVTDQPSYKMYKGKKPLEAKEVKALVDLTKQVDPQISVAYHSSGRQIFGSIENKRITPLLENLTGYKSSTPIKTAIGGGYTDWFIEEYNRPSYTLEISYLVEETEPPIEVFEEVWNRNQAVGLLLASEGYHLWEESNTPWWRKWFEKL